MNNIDLSQNEHWACFVLSGILTTPLIPLGEGPDMYILSENDFSDDLKDDFKIALKKSIRSFGFEFTNNFEFSNPKLLLVPMSEFSDLAIKNVLIVSDMALAFFNRKYFSAKAQFLSWNRKEGKAIGAIFSNGNWKPILSVFGHKGPGIVRPLNKDFWDWFLGASLRNQLNELADALYKCIEWERESKLSSHITHKFAFNWIALEAMLPKGEVKEGTIIKRLSLLVGAPRKSDSKKIRNNTHLNQVYQANQNPYSNQWVKVIKEMYQYRCCILHEGASDLSSIDIDPKKVDWFYHLSRSLNDRVIGLTVNALVDNIDAVADFWDTYALNYLYSSRNHWIKNGTFIQKDLITFNWKDEFYPEIF